SCLSRQSWLVANTLRAVNSVSTCSCTPRAPSTVTGKLHEPRFPAESDATQRILVTPIANVCPERGVQTTVTDEQRSTARGRNSTLAPCSLVNSTTKFVGQTKLGAVVSTTVMVKLHELEFPLLSLAMQVTRVVPRGNCAPDSGMQWARRTPSHTSI